MASQGLSSLLPPARPCPAVTDRSLVRGAGRRRLQGSHSCTLPSSGGKGRTRGRIPGLLPQQSSAVTVPELCVCFCNPPFFLIVILAVVKGAGLTGRGDGRASELHRSLHLQRTQRINRRQCLESSVDTSDLLIILQQFHHLQSD